MALKISSITLLAIFAVLSLVINYYAFYQRIRVLDITHVNHVFDQRTALESHQSELVALKQSVREITARLELQQAQNADLRRQLAVSNKSTQIDQPLTLTRSSRTDIVQTSFDVVSRAFGASEAEQWCDQHVGLGKIKAFRSLLTPFCSGAGMSRVNCTYIDNEYYCKYVDMPLAHDTYP
jgi:hypothetical protein